ncbi:MAG: divalent-cation tolerance protein CutA [Planctomycetota bacterium]
MDPDPAHPWVVLCTAPDPDTADRLARDLVELRLAACVQVLPGMRSHYRWAGELQCESEVLLPRSVWMRAPGQPWKPASRINTRSAEILALPAQAWSAACMASGWRTARAAGVILLPPGAPPRAGEATTRSAGGSPPGGGPHEPGWPLPGPREEARANGGGKEAP